MTRQQGTRILDSRLALEQAFGQITQYRGQHRQYRADNHDQRMLQILRAAISHTRSHPSSQQQATEQSLNSLLRTDGG